MPQTHTVTLDVAGDLSPTGQEGLLLGWGGQERPLGGGPLGC